MPSESELVDLARSYLSRLQPRFVDTPVFSVTFQTADEITPYDRWEVLLGTVPGRDPDFAVIEILCPEMTVRHFPMM